MTTMVYSWDPEARIARFSTTADRVEPKHLRHDPRAALHVPGGDVWSFAVAEGEASVATDGSEGVGTGGSSGRRSGDELRALAAAGARVRPGRVGDGPGRSPRAPSVGAVRVFAGDRLDLNFAVSVPPVASASASRVIRLVGPSARLSASVARTSRAEGVVTDTVALQ
ncbi:hypothetical protein ACFUIT_10825 [Streptomyces sp. NPDC057239]|uniref:hypothetical protein n=1 Tax=Streptomyces sp. NPDC057239 TaxID=3346061 RepID=UPI0036413ED4